MRCSRRTVPFFFFVQIKYWETRLNEKRVMARRWKRHMSAPHHVSL